MSTGPRNAPQEFVAAMDSLRDVPVRPEVVLEEVPGPARIAPFTAALNAEVRPTWLDREEDELASGRFVVLHDPAGQEAWDGSFRLVTLVRTILEPEQGSDQLFPEGAWSWLTDAMRDHGVEPRATGGTVTRVLSHSFGALEERPEQAELELRASWTARDKDLSPHLLVWTQLLCSVAGLPPLPVGVVPIRPLH